MTNEKVKCTLIRVLKKEMNNKYKNKTLNIWIPKSAHSFIVGILIYKFYSYIYNLLIYKF